RTISSPLSLLAKPGALRQETLPGLPAPHDTSRFSVARVAFILRRSIETIKSYRDRTGVRIHTLKSEHKASGASSSLSWSEGEKKKVVFSAKLPGDVKMTP